MNDRPIDARHATNVVTIIVIGTMAIGPFINYAFSALAPFLVSRTSLSSGHVGAIVTAIFAFATVTSARAGSVVDRRGAVWSSKLLLAFASVALLVIVVADRLAVFLVGAVFAGVAHALSHPTSNGLVAALVPTSRQGLVVGLKQSGVQVGQVLAGLLLPLLAPLVGWRVSVLTGFVLIVAAAVGLRSLEPPAPTRPEHRVGGKRIRDRSVAWLAAYALILGVASQGTNVYISLFTFDELGFSERAAGLMVAVVGATGVVSRIAWGVWASRLRTMWRPLTSIATMMCVAIGLFWGAMSAGIAMLVAAVALFSFSATAVSVLLSVALIKSPRLGEIGINSGVVIRGLYAGYMAGPFMFGWIVEVVGYATAWAVMAVFALGAVVTASTVIRRLPVEAGA